jgi:hypothetical protein
MDNGFVGSLIGAKKTLGEVEIIKQWLYKRAF